MIHQTLVFDFDGTIADTLGETRRIFNQIAPDYGIRQVEEQEVERLRHLSLKQLLHHLDIPKRRVPALIARGTGLLRSAAVDRQLQEVRRAGDARVVVTDRLLAAPLQRLVV